MRHYKGSFPFKHLACTSCSRIICSGCISTEILSPIPFGMVNAPHTAVGKEVRYLQVCPQCGLSHRAEMVGTTLDFYGVTCVACGNSSFGDWPRYHIGSVEPYRKDPNASYARCVEMRAERAAHHICGQEE